jgi:uncharacterized membrane protein (DUF485 family)
MAAEQTGRDPDEGLRNVDWEAVEQTEEFQELVKSRRRFVVPATIFFLLWYLGFILLAGYAPDFMGESVYQGLTVGYCLALTQFLMVFVLGLMYLRRADRTFDPLSDKVAKMVAERGTRFDRPAGAPATTAGTATPAAGAVSTTEEPRP